MKAALYLLLAALLVACSSVNGEQPTMSAESQLSYLALGDSYTIGESVAVGERWPVQLAAALQAQGVAMGEPTIIARTGWTTGELQAAIVSSYHDETYDLVTLLIGVNNQFRGQSLETYRTEFKELLTFAISAAGGRGDHVIVLSIPDWWYTPFGQNANRSEVSAEIDAFNVIGREESTAAGVAFVDITPSTRTALDNADMLAGDGLHPSAAMYAQWVEQVLPYALEKLGK